MQHWRKPLSKLAICGSIKILRKKIIVCLSAPIDCVQTINMPLFLCQSLFKFSVLLLRIVFRGNYVQCSKNGHRAPHHNFVMIEMSGGSSGLVAECFLVKWWPGISLAASETLVYLSHQKYVRSFRLYWLMRSLTQTRALYSNRLQRPLT